VLIIHPFGIQFADQYSRIIAQCTSTLSRIGLGGKFQMGSGPGFHDADRETLNHQGHEASRRFSVLGISFVNLSALGGERFRKLIHDRSPSSLAVISNM
jgi:hypothetical protein